MEAHSEQKIISYCLIFLSAVAFTFSLIFTKTVLVPFVFSIFVYAVLSPFLKFLQGQLRVPKALAILFMSLLIFIAMSILLFLLASSLNAFIVDAAAYRDKTIELLEKIKLVSASVGIDFEGEAIRSELKNWPIFSWIKSLTGGLLSLVGNIFLITIFSLFLLAGEQSLITKPKFFVEVQNKISRYVTIKFFVSLATGVLTWIILFAFDIDLAFMFAFIAFSLNFIPSIGSIVAVLVPLPVVMLQFGFGIEMIGVLAITGCVQLVIGNLVEPKLMGESMGLHPVVILLFLMFWGLVWGIPGMFLAVPITAILRIVLSKIEATRPLASYLSGRFT